ncbi:MAG: ATP-binding cassette domain-containing protein [Negativicutes bacterium]|nr:ATP-binding cassette domain-containing protein [Negativicutes bacterium]
MGLLDVIDISHSFGENVLYKNASFELFKGEHMGLVGHNGTGKTTLFNIIVGSIVPDQGRISWQRNLNYEYLDQYAKTDNNATVFEYLKTAFQELIQTESKLIELYESMTTDSSEELIDKAAKLQEILEYQGFYEIETVIMKVANGLGITALGMDSILGQLSGGQRAKVILAKLLLEKPDVLLLDEPTNFLDKEHVEWFSGYLKEFEGAFIVISHDFDFLDLVTNCICDIEFGVLTKYSGNFNKFLQLKDIKRESYIREFQSQQVQIKKFEEYISKNKARASTAKMARGRQKQLDRIEIIEPPKALAKPNFQFASLPVTTQKALVVRDLEIGYTNPLLPKINFMLAAGQKIVITGFNGIGKSTLIKTLIKQIPSLSGDFKFSDTMKIGYYEQDLVWGNPKQTPVQIIAEKYSWLSASQIRKHLAQCGIQAKSVIQPISALSGGEQSRVKLCILMLTKSNLLILDEPTNHLDADAKDVLKNELIRWQGNIILVSHEEAFYRKWVDQVIHIGG